MRRAATALTPVLCALALAACDESGGGSDETEPSFEQAQAIAEEQLAGEGCEFQVEDESSDESERKSLNCLVTQRGQELLFPIFSYTRDLNVEEVDALIPGFTTAERYFENGNIQIDPSGGNPSAVQLDAEEFTGALVEECDCGEVLTPTQ